MLNVSAKDEEKPKETLENKDNNIEIKGEIKIGEVKEENKEIINKEVVQAQPEEIKENINEIKEESVNIEAKPINETEPNKEIILTEENKANVKIEKKEENAPQVTKNEINISSNDKKEEVKPIQKNESGIIFKKLIKAEDNSPYEEIKLKPRKLKTKLYFARTKLDFGNENVKEITSLTQNGLKYLSNHELDVILRSLKVPYTLKEEIIKFHYKDALDMLRTLKRSGVTGFSKNIWTRGRINSFIDEYESRFSDENGVYLTWHLYYVIVRNH